MSNLVNIYSLGFSKNKIKKSSWGPDLVGKNEWIHLQSVKTSHGSKKERQVCKKSNG